MLKKMMITIALLAGVIGSAQAVTAPVVAAPAPVASATVVENPHQSRDAIFRACKLDADNKKLLGIARTSAIATCVKTTPR